MDVWIITRFNISAGCCTSQANGHATRESMIACNGEQAQDFLVRYIKEWYDENDEDNLPKESVLLLGAQEVMKNGSLKFGRDGCDCGDFLLIDRVEMNHERKTYNELNGNAFDVQEFLTDATLEDSVAKEATSEDES